MCYRQVQQLPNQALQRTLDSSRTFAVAKVAVASSAAELGG